jgi:hypothetical protein
MGNNTNMEWPTGYRINLRVDSLPRKSLPASATFLRPPLVTQ